ncbi:hypothetical protein BZG36_00227 [Bifiguratus adelaidae]|uniref:HECT-type E3 ubiquitin transferase n=1 Tax=Bifiguratus adelaidae TaxID=1938954 RepID=A0A261Y9C5_9FUNG|nr:hypothetical protein BZG36_00227 [Bifiguratus adelaidae]
MDRPKGPNIYALNDDVQQLLQVDKFQGDFEIKSFVEKISAGLVEQAKQSHSNALDPKPFIRTFEAVIDCLNALKAEVREQCDMLDGEVQLAEAAHVKKVKDLGPGFDDVYKSFDSLESKITEVGNTAIRIGEQLEQTDRQRTRVSEGRDLLEYFLEFNTGQSERLDWLRTNGGSDGELKAAVIARRLNAIIKDVSVPGKARSSIEKFCETFERDFLRDFDRAYKDYDPKAMAHCAKVLYEFNGGGSCVQIYVNQHEFFISHLKIAEMDDVSRFPDDHDLGNPLMPPPEVDRVLIDLYEEITITVRREAEIIAAVFPDPSAVLQVFLQRIFAQSIQIQIEFLVSRAEKSSSIAYLRTLASTHAETAAFVDSLKRYCEEEAKKFFTSASANASSPSLASTLDRCMDDLFVPYIEGDRYLKRETQALTEVFQQCIHSFATAQQSRKPRGGKQSSAFTRALNTMATSTSAPHIAGMGSSIASAGLGNQGGKRDQNESSGGLYGYSNLAQSTGNLQGHTGDKELLSTDLALQMVGVHAEAMARCIELVDIQELPQVISALFSLLVEYLGTRYVETALDSAMEDADSRNDVDLGPMKVVKSATDIMFLLQKHFQEAILPLINSQPKVHGDVVFRKNNFISKMEHKANKTVQRTVDSITNQLANYLSRQKKSDFRPKDENAMVGVATTCVELLRQVQQVAMESLESKNGEVFLSEIGIAFHSQLLDHFKKFVVSPSGALLVTKDIAKYQDIIQTFRIPSLNDRFEMLRQLGNVFVVKPEILKSILSEGYLARLDAHIIHPYLQMRSDYKSAKIEHLLGVMESHSTLDHRHKRLSVFVKDSQLGEMMKSRSRDYVSYMGAMGAMAPTSMQRVKKTVVIQRPDDSAQGLRTLTSLLVCAVCRSPLVEPVTLSCGYTLCKACLPAFHPDSAWRFTCPVRACRHTSHLFVKDVMPDMTLCKLLAFASKSKRDIIERHSQRIKRLTKPPIFESDSDTVTDEEFHHTLSIQSDSDSDDDNLSIYSRHSNGFGDPLWASYSSESDTEETWHEELMNELDCNVCLSLFYDPVITPCGHTFCQECLLRTIDHGPYCPTCRQLIPGYKFFKQHAISSTLSTIIQTIFPVQHQQRHLAAIAQSTTNELTEVPIFICSLAFPNMPCILHVFEDRYKRMLQHTIDSNRRRFGLCLPGTGGEPFREYGTMLEIRRLELTSDGRSLVETVGSWRFRVKSRRIHQGYYTAHVERIEDITPEEEATREAQAIAQHAMSTQDMIYYSRAFATELRTMSAPWLLQRLSGYYGDMPIDPCLFSWWMAALLPVPEEERYRLLAIDSIHARVQLIVHWIRLLRTQRVGCRAQEFYRRHFHFLQLHYTYFITLTFVFSGLLCIKAGDNYPFNYVDALFFSASAISLTGLNTIDLSQLSFYQQFLLFVLMLLGSQVLISGFIVRIRRHWFEKEFEQIVRDLRRRRLEQRRHRRSGLSSTEPSKREDTGRENGATASGEREQDTLHHDVDRDVDQALEEASSETQTDDRKTNSYQGQPKDTKITFTPDVSNHANQLRQRREATTVSEAEPALTRSVTGISMLSQRSIISRPLTEAERQQLGGAEYGALRTLEWVVGIYFVVMQVGVALILRLWLACSPYWTGVLVSQPGSPDPWWFSFFISVSAFNNVGFSLVNANMVPFENALVILIFMSILIVFGNTGYALALRLILWTLWRTLPEKYAVQRDVYKFLLDHPRRCFTTLFPARQTWWLLVVLIILTCAELFFFLVLNLTNSAVTMIPWGYRIMDGLFQAFATRTGGFAVVNLSALNQGVLVLYVLSMYISVYPVTISLRHTNIYEQRSLGIYDANDDTEFDEKDLSTSFTRTNSVSSNFAHSLSRTTTFLSNLGTPERQRTSFLKAPDFFVMTQIRHQLTSDIGWIILALFLICAIESTRIAQDINFSVFAIIFETVSAFANVGISFGYPNTTFSFSGQWTTACKVILCVIMIRGRHRGLPAAIDRSVLLPSEAMHQLESEDYELRRSNTRRNMQGILPSIVLSEQVSDNGFGTRQVTNLGTRHQKGVPGDQIRLELVDPLHFLNKGKRFINIVWSFGASVDEGVEGHVGGVKLDSMPYPGRCSQVGEATIKVKEWQPAKKLRRPRHKHDRPDETYLFRNFTPDEFDSMGTCDDTWQVTTPSDVKEGRDGIPFLVDNGPTGAYKFMGRPPKTKWPRHQAEPSRKPSFDQPAQYARSDGDDGKHKDIKEEQTSPKLYIPTSMSMEHPPYVVVSSVLASKADRQVAIGAPTEAGNAPLWTLSETPFGTRIFLDISRMSDYKTTLASLIAFLSGGAIKLPDIDLDLAKRNENAEQSDEQIFSSSPRTNSLEINRNILAKYTVRAYTRDAYDSGLCGPRDAVTLVTDTDALELVVIPPLYSAANATFPLNAIIETIVRQYLVCGNGYHPLLHRTTVLKRLQGSSDPTSDALFNVIVAGKSVSVYGLIAQRNAAWARHTLLIHQSEERFSTVESIKPLEMYFRQRAWTLFEELFDDMCYETLWILCVFMLGCTAERHPTLHQLAGRFISAMGLHDKVHSQSVQETTTDPQERFALEMERRAWWDFNLNNDCCKVMPFVPYEQFDQLILTKRLPDENDVDWQNIQFHFHAKMALRNIERKHADRIEESRTLSLDEINFYDTIVEQWYTHLPDFLKANRMDTDSATRLSSWAVEINIRKHLALISMKRLLIQDAASPHTFSAIRACTDFAVAITRALYVCQLQHYCRPHIRTWHQVCGTMMDLLAETRQTLGLNEAQMRLVDRAIEEDAVEGAYSWMHDARRVLAMALYLLQQTDAFKRQIPGYVDYGQDLGLFENPSAAASLRFFHTSSLSEGSGVVLARRRPFTSNCSVDNSRDTSEDSDEEDRNDRRGGGRVIFLASLSSSMGLERCTGEGNGVGTCFRASCISLVWFAACSVDPDGIGLPLVEKHKESSVRRHSSPTTSRKRQRTASTSTMNRRPQDEEAVMHTLGKTRSRKQNALEGSEKSEIPPPMEVPASAPQSELAAQLGIPAHHPLGAVGAIEEYFDEQEAMEDIREEHEQANDHSEEHEEDGDRYLFMGDMEGMEDQQEGDSEHHEEGQDVEEDEEEEDDDDDDDGDEENEDGDHELEKDDDEEDDDEHEHQDGDDTFHAAFGRGSSSFFHAMRGMPGIGMRSALQTEQASQYRSMLSGLRSQDPSEQLIALQQLAEALSMGNENTLAGVFSTDAFVKELVKLLKGGSATEGLADYEALDEETLAMLGMTEGNPDIMILACRCLSNLVEAMPSAMGSIVYGGAVPALCSKLIDIQYIDLAEQVISTLEKISVEYPSHIIRVGGLKGVLSYLDFFSSHVQRTVLTTAANCCRSVPQDCVENLQEVVPTIQMTLTYADQKVVEQSCLCFVRLADSFRYNRELLEQIIPNSALTTMKSLVAGSGQAAGVSHSIFTQLLRFFGTIAKSSPKLGFDLLNMGIVDTLYNILSGKAAPEELGADDHATISTESRRSSDARAGSTLTTGVAHRPRDQIYETLGAVIELLPPLPKDGLFDTKSDGSEQKAQEEPIASRTRSASKQSEPSKDDKMQETMKAEDERIELLKKHSNVLRRFGQTFVPVLTQVFAATVNTQIRQRIMTGLLKIVYFSEPDILDVILSGVPFAGFLASILAQQDQTSIVITGLQLTELLLMKLPDRYSFHLRREGVFYEIDKIADSQELPEEASVNEIAKDQAVRVQEVEMGVNHAEGRAADAETSATGAMIAASALASCSRGISNQRSVISSITEETKSAIVRRAHRLRQTYFQNDDTAVDGSSATSATQVLNDLAKYSSQLNGTQADPTALEVLRRIADLFTKSPYGISSFELMNSGLMTGLLGYLNDEGSDFVAPLQDRLYAFMHVFMNGPGTDELKHLVNNPSNDDDDAMRVDHHSDRFPEDNVSKNPVHPPVLLSMLLARLQESLSRLENFEVVMAYQSPLDEGRRNPAAMLAKQLRLKLTAEDPSDFGTCPDLIVSIHAIATFRALEQYLRPRLSQSGLSGIATLEHLAASSGSSRLTNMLSAFAAAAGLSAESESGQNQEDEEDEEDEEERAAMEQPKWRSRRSGRESKADESAHASTSKESKKKSSSSAETLSNIRHQGVADSSGNCPPSSEKTVDMSAAEDELSTPKLGAAKVSTGGSKKAKKDTTKPSYAAALNTPPKDWHLEFSIGDIPVGMDTTIYGAIHQYEKMNSGYNRNIWSTIFPVKYRKVPGPAPLAQTGPTPADQSRPVTLKDLCSATVPDTLDLNAKHTTVLALLRTLNALNRFWQDIYAVKLNGLSRPHFKPLGHEEFFNNKVTAKLNRQLEEPLLVASAVLPEWSADLVRGFPFLFPFSTRYLFLQSTSFGYSRSMVRWQSQQNRSGDSRSDDTQYLGRPVKQKVRISRMRMLESAVKVMDLYSQSQAFLEIEYFEEVGTGLGPTLEFYATISKEFCKKSNKMWRDDLDNASSAYVSTAYGLFPAPLSESNINTDNGRKILQLFRVLGQFVGKAMLDSRIIDIPFSTIFVRELLGEMCTVNVRLVAEVDRNLGKSLAVLDAFVTRKRQIYADKSLSTQQQKQRVSDLRINDASVDDMCLDFTLPGYPDIELRPAGAEVPVTIYNLEEYIDAVVDMTCGSGVQHQISAFNDGFSSVFPIIDLKIFTAEELVDIWGSSEDEDWSVETLIDAMKADHGYTMDSRTIKNLVQILASFSPAEHREFLQFITGSPKLPIGGWKNLSPMFTVVRKPFEPPLTADDYLPSVMTCVNYLKLPDYSTEQVLREKLSMAMREGKGSFHLS